MRLGRATRSTRSHGRGGVGAPGQKISITIDAKILSNVQKVARRTHRTLSADVSEALARDLRNRRLREITDEFEAEHGAITDDELAAARKAWRA